MIKQWFKIIANKNIDYRNNNGNSFANIRI